MTELTKLPEAICLFSEYLPSGGADYGYIRVYQSAFGAFGAFYMKFFDYLQRRYKFFLLDGHDSHKAVDYIDLMLEDSVGGRPGDPRSQVERANWLGEQELNLAGDSLDGPCAIVKRGNISGLPGRFILLYRKPDYNFMLPTCPVLFKNRECAMEKLKNIQETDVENSSLSSEFFIVKVVNVPGEKL